MARLRAATLIEALAAMSIIAIVIAVAFFTMVQLQRSSLDAMRHKAEQRIDRLLIDEHIERDFEGEGVYYEIVHQEIGESGWVSRVVTAKFEERVLICRKVICPITDR